MVQFPYVPMQNASLEELQQYWKEIKSDREKEIQKEKENRNSSIGSETERRY